MPLFKANVASVKLLEPPGGSTNFDLLTLEIAKEASY